MKRFEKIKAPAEIYFVHPETGEGEVLCVEELADNVNMYMVYDKTGEAHNVFFVHTNLEPL